MSSTGTTLEITPLLPCRPAILSPSVILRICATLTRTIFSTPVLRSRYSSRSNTLTSTTLPRSPWGKRKLESFTSRAFSPNIARSNFSSGLSSFSPLGVILPTRMSRGPTSAPMRTMPSSSKSFSASSPTLGMSRVISSGPSLVSRASTSCFSMWMEVNLSPSTIRSLMRMASSKFPPSQDIKAHTTFCPSASPPSSVEELSAST